jgi:hypothetical protein
MPETRILITKDIQIDSHENKNPTSFLKNDILNKIGDEVIYEDSKKELDCSVIPTHYWNEVLRHPDCFKYLTLPEEPKICIKFPTRSRPEKFFKCIQNIQEMIGYQNYYIAVTADMDDPTMNNEEVRQKIMSLQIKGLSIFLVLGSSKNKVDAINRDTLAIKSGLGFDILILTSDDMNFIHPNFGQEIVDDFKKYFQDGDGLLHYPDGFANERLVTMPIMGCKYFERFNYIYHPDYISLHCDNEQMEVARRLNRYKFINKRLFDHNHPAWGMSARDAQYEHTESFYHIDEETFKKRVAINFGI